MNPMIPYQHLTGLTFMPRRQLTKIPSKESKKSLSTLFKMFKKKALIVINRYQLEKNMAG